MSGRQWAGALLTWVPFLAFATVGAMILARRPGNRIGWLCWAIGFTFTLSGLSSGHLWEVLTADQDWSAAWALAAQGERRPSVPQAHRRGAHRLIQWRVLASRPAGGRRRPRRQSDPGLAATQGDQALHRSIDGEASGQPEGEMATGRNATGRS